MTQAVYNLLPADKAARVRITAGDISEAMVKLANERFERNGWPVTAHVIDEQVSDNVRPSMGQT